MHYGRQAFVFRQHDFFLLQNVFTFVRLAWQLNVHGARTTATRNMKRFRHYLGDILDALDTRTPLGDVFEHLVNEGRIIDAVKGFHIRFQRHRAADMHHRRSRAVGLRHTSHRVDTTGPRRDQTNAGLAGEAPVCIGHQRSIRLHFAGHEAHRFDTTDAVVDRMDV